MGATKPQRVSQDESILHAAKQAGMIPRISMEQVDKAFLVTSNLGYCRPCGGWRAVDRDGNCCAMKKIGLDQKGVCGEITESHHLLNEMLVDYVKLQDSVDEAVNVNEARDLMHNMTDFINDNICIEETSHYTKRNGKMVKQTSLTVHLDDKHKGVIWYFEGERGYHVAMDCNDHISQLIVDYVEATQLPVAK